MSDEYDIAAAPQLVRDLVAEVTRLRAAIRLGANLDALRAEVARAYDLTRDDVDAETGNGEDESEDKE